MATVVAGGNFPVNVDAIRLGTILNGTVAVANSELIRVVYSNGSANDFIGSFRYDGFGNLGGGTLNAVTETFNGQAVYVLSGLSTPALTFYNWVLTNSTTTAKNSILGGNDSFTGSTFNNLLRSFGGADVVAAGEGDDTIDGGTGTDTIDGGAGTDFAIISGASTAYRLVSYNGTVGVAGSAGDILTNVEFVAFSNGNVSTTTAQAFDPRLYVAANVDLARAFGTNADAGYAHYVGLGAAEGRSTSFNILDYMAANPDLVAAFGLNGEAALNHYLTAGALEGRSTAFDGLAYVASHADLIRSIGANDTAGVLHYVAAGRGEGRTVTFSPSAYLAANADLRTAFASNLDAATTHYIDFGAAEGRRTSAAARAMEGEIVVIDGLAGWADGMTLM